MTLRQNWSKPSICLVDSETYMMVDYAQWLRCNSCTWVLGVRLCGTTTVHHVPKCMTYHETIIGLIITERIYLPRGYKT